MTFKIVFVAPKLPTQTEVRLVLTDNSTPLATGAKPEIRESYGLNMKMGDERASDRGRTTPPTSQQQGPLSKDSGQILQTSTGIGPCPSSVDISNMNQNVGTESLYINMNQNSGNSSRTVHYGQYTSQSQASAQRDKQGGNVMVASTITSTFPTTYSTIQPAANGYVPCAPHTLIMNSDGPGPMSSQNYMNPGIVPMQNVDSTNITGVINNNDSMNAPRAMNFLPYGTHMNTVVDETAAPPWVAQLFHGLDSRLQQIESHISTQNKRWEQIEGVLHAQTRSLRDQNSRISSMESQMFELNKLKGKVTLVETKMQMIDSDIRKSNQQINEYQKSIDTYSDLYDEIKTDKQSSDDAIGDLIERVGSLEADHSKLEKTVVDLQCRSMRDNLVFTGIDEVELDEGEDYENVEKTLVTFLQNEMDIYQPIGFHRVHRIGPIDSSLTTPRPRPIVAKFERFKDREFVRSKASQTLRNKKYGVREQFPKIIEDKRKLLYPEAKKARQNEENKVRMVRDKLYVNNTEVVVEQQDGNGTSFHPTRQNSYRREPQWQRGNNGDYRGSRVFYRGGRKYQGSKPRSLQSASGAIDFSVPISNRFGPLAETPSRGQIKMTESKKHPASSPLEEQTVKKYRDEPDNENSISEMTVDPQNTSAQSQNEGQINSAMSIGDSLDIATPINDNPMPGDSNSVTSTLTVHITSPGPVPVKDTGMQQSNDELYEA